MAREKFDKMFGDKWLSIALSGAVAGFLNWLPGIPFDPIKTIMQSNLKETSMVKVFKEG